MQKTLLFIVAFLVSGLVYCQGDFVPETYFGIRGGANTSGIVSDPTIYLDLNPGFSGGAVFKHISQRSLGIQIEFNYVQAGWKENLDSPNAYSRRLNYLQLPIMSHVSIGKKNTRILINLGPYASYLISENEESKLLEGAEQEDYYGRKASNKAGFGMCFGLGVSQYTEVGVFELEGRVSYTLSNVYKTKPDLNLSSSKNIVAEVSLSYLIDYNKVKDRVVARFAAVKEKFQGDR